MRFSHIRYYLRCQRLPRPDHRARRWPRSQHWTWITTTRWGDGVTCVTWAGPVSIINWYLMRFNCSWCINNNVINKQKEEEDALSAQELAATRGYYRDWVSQGFKEEEDVYFKFFKDVIQHSWVCCRSTWFHLPPITVKEFLVENGSVGTKEGYRVKVGWVNGVLKW